MTSRPILESRHLTIGYRQGRKADVELASGLNLRLERGRLTALLGPNGAGKSTLLRTLAGMQKPLAGQVLLAGEDVGQMKAADIARRLSVVLTAAPHPGWMTGYALVALGRHPYTDWLGRLSAYDRAMIGRALDAVDAADLARRPVVELSDGQRQKLMIARALAQETDVMLLDEPTAFLDVPRRVETMRLLKDLAQETQRAILLATHDLDLALRCCDRLWMMTPTALVTGAPEDLVLDDIMAAAFGGNGIAFDKRKGAFVMERATGASVCLRGEGIPQIWMRRALERAGYRVSDAPAAIRIELDPDRPEWQVAAGDSHSRHRTIAAVLTKLDEASPPARVNGRPTNHRK